MNPNGRYKMTLLEELQVARPGLKSAVLWVGVFFSILEITFLDRNLKNKAGGGFFFCLKHSSLSCCIKYVQTLVLYSTGDVMGCFICVWEEKPPTSPWF